MTALAGFNHGLTVYNGATSIINKVSALLHLPNDLLGEHAPEGHHHKVNIRGEMEAGI